MTYQYTYFIDRALGKSVGKALQELGVDIKFHHDYFAPDAPDTEWLPIASQRGWIVLTKDVNIGRNALELLAIARADAKVFILVGGNLSGQEIRNIFLKCIDKIEKIAKGNQPPFIAKIRQNNRVEIWRKRSALVKIIEKT